MSKEVMWTKRTTEIFIEEGQLTEEQIFILKTRIKGWSITMQADELNRSISSINREIALMKKIYDACALKNPELPPRRRSKAEQWMDTH